MDAFMTYIDGLGRLDDNDLYENIDETMKDREAVRKLERQEAEAYTSKKRNKTMMTK